MKNTFSILFQKGIFLLCGLLQSLLDLYGIDHFTQFHTLQAINYCLVLLICRSFEIRLRLRSKSFTELFVDSTLDRLFLLSHSFRKYLLILNSLLSSFSFQFLHNFCNSILWQNLNRCDYALICSLILLQLKTKVNQKLNCCISHRVVSIIFNQKY